VVQLRTASENRTAVELLYQASNGKLAASSVNRKAVDLLYQASNGKLAASSVEVALLCLPHPIRVSSCV
jgi:hypothetical protein